MIYKYLKGSQGMAGGSKGGGDNGSSGGTPKPYNLDGVVDPFFIGMEYLATVDGTDEQLDGMRSMLHSLQPPSNSPENFTPAPNYNAVDQEHTDIKEDLSDTKILGNDINQHIAQQQALGERGVEVDHQRVKAIADLRNSELAQKAEDEFKNGLKRHQDQEARRVFDLSIRQQIQDNVDTAVAIKTDAAKKVGQEFYTLHKLKDARKDARNMARMQRQYFKDRQAALDGAKDTFSDDLETEFWNQFKTDYKNPDVETIISKYGIDPDEFGQDFDKIRESEAYQKRLQEFKDSKIEDWTKKYNQTLVDFDDWWWGQNENAYFGYKFKEGGKVQTKTKDTPKERILERISRKNEKIAVDNNRALRNFVEQMNEKQAKIFLKLMSI